MAALTQDRKQTIQNGGRALPDLHNLAVKASVKIYKGALVVMNAGYAAPGTTATGLIAVGRAEEQVDNTTGANGAKRVQVRRGAFVFGNSSAGDLIAITDIGADCYIVDDQTVAKTNGTGTRSRAGVIVDVDTNGVTVLVGFGV